MKKTVILTIFLILLLLIILLVFLNFSLEITGKATSEQVYSWTKAICNETHCQDFEIVCNGKEVISRTPITGAFLHPENWSDPRDWNFRNRFCD